MDSDAPGDGIDPGEAGNPRVGPGPGPRPEPSGPAAGPPGDDDPLYKFGDSRARLRSILDTLVLVIAAFVGANVLVFVALQVGVLSGLVTVPGGAASLAELPGSAVALALSANFVAYFIIGAVYLYWRDGSTPFSTRLYSLSLPSLRDVGWIVGGTVGLFMLLGLVSVVALRFGLQPSTNSAETLGRANPPLLLFMAVNALLLNGPAEEFLFRGIVQGLFRDAYGIVPGVLLSAGVFSVIHFLALSGGSIAYTLAVIGVLGAVLGALYEWSGNLLVPAVVHGAFNAVQFVGLYVSAT